MTRELGSTSTYSSKFKTMRLVRTFSAESRGTEATNTGGRESLLPPVGGMMLAQPTAPKRKAMSRRRKIEPGRLIGLCIIMNGANLICFGCWGIYFEGFIGLLGIQPSS